MFEIFYYYDCDDGGALVQCGFDCILEVDYIEKKLVRPFFFFEIFFVNETYHPNKITTTTTKLQKQQ